MYLFLLPLLVLSCLSKKKEETKEPNTNERTPELAARYQENLALAETLRNPINRWLTPKDCDGMIWAGKYSCGGGDPDIRAAEYPEEKGRFDRRPPPYCWTPELGDQGSKTTWSRDMGIAGLFPHALCKRDLQILADHAAFGESAKWEMGQPLADGRAIYTPAVIGSLYSLIYALGGPSDKKRGWTGIYPKGLDDYKAHLQMMDIWMRLEISGPLPPLPGEPIEFSADLSKTLVDRINEHADREPQCPFYQFMKGRFSGSQDRTVDLLLSSNEPACSYVRGESLALVQLSEWLFVARATLAELNGLP